MVQKKEEAHEQPAETPVSSGEKQHEHLSWRVGISKRVTDHLANERTFLAWIRTGLAVITFGFVIERFGLLLRELGVKEVNRPIITGHYSTLIGITLTLLGVLMMIFALLNFLHYRSSIDAETFHPRSRYAVALTIVASLIGIVLAVYLYVTT